MKFIRLNKKNHTKLVSISKRCFPKSYVDDQVIFWFKKRLDGSYKATNNVLEYFLVFDKKPVGVTGFFQIKGQKTFWLGYFGVVPDKRRKGLGSEILGRTMRLAKQRGAKRLSVWGDSIRAEKFYKANGFRKIKKQDGVVINGELVYRYPPRTYFYTKKL